MRLKFILLFTSIASIVLFISIKTNVHEIKMTTSESAMQIAPQSQDVWFATITEKLINQTYEFTQSNEGEYNAINRANNLSFKINASQFSIEKSTDSKNWQSTMQLNSILIDGSRVSLENIPNITLDKNELSYDYKQVQIQYINTQQGLRQNFIVHNRSIGSNQIKINLDLKTSLNKELTNQNVLHLIDGKTEAFQYADLQAYDVIGAKLPAHMELNGNEISLIVDASLAMFPIVIDPLSSAPVWSIESDQANAYMGFSCSMVGDVNNDGYDDVIVAAGEWDSPTLNVGKCILYLGSATGLSTTEAWSHVGTNVGGLYGKAVDGAGDVNGDGYDDVIISAGLYSGAFIEEGVAFLYYGNATGINLVHDWEFYGGQNYADLGFPLRGLGDVNGDGYDDIIVGSSGFDNPEIDEGRAYAFYGSSTGLAATPNWTVEGNQAGCRFGKSVNSAGDVNNDGYNDAIVGAYNYSGAVANAGKSYVYLGSATGLNTTAIWTKEGDQIGGFYGFWTAGVGDVNKDNYDDIIVGAKRYDFPENDEGVAYLHLGTATGPSNTVSWTGQADNLDAEYSTQFSGAGDVNGDGYADVLIGAHYYSGTLSKEGKLYCYLGSSAGLSPTPNWTYLGGQAQCNMGWSCDGGGDVNGDGYDDIIAGGFKYTNGQSLEGVCLVFHGQTTCLAPTGLVASAITSSSAVMSFTPIWGITQYKIVAKRSGETKVFTATSSPFTMTGLTANKKYKVTIQAKCSAVYGPISPIVQVQTLPMRTGNFMSTEPILYPNPAATFVTVNASILTKENASISIVDLQGQLIRTIFTNMALSSGEVTLNVEDLLPGCYFCKIETSNKKTVLKFIKN